MHTVEIRKGPWKHNQEGLRYNVLGNALIIKSPADLIGRRNIDLIGTALFVEGYEESHEIKGYKIQVYEDREAPIGPNRLRFLKIGDFDAPESIVVYRQLEKGVQYSEGQLWWRSPENFTVNFTPIDVSQL